MKTPVSVLTEEGLQGDSRDYLSCLIASWQGTNVSESQSVPHDWTWHWHMLLLVSLELEDHWRRDESLWRVSGSAWKSEVMGNAYIGCHYADHIQKSHRKTGWINLCDQEITYFSSCPLIVPCRRDGLCQMPDTGRQKVLSCRMSPEAGGEQFVLCTEGFACAELSQTSDSPVDTGNWS